MSGDIERLAHRRNRTIAAILGYKEQHLDAVLTEEQRAMLRKIVLDNVNELFDTAKAIIEDSDRVIVNEYYLRKIDEVHAGVIEIAAGLNGDH